MKNLPEPRQKVMAFFEGASHHTGPEIAWDRRGWAEMVRWDDDPEHTVADGWSRSHYDAAMKKIDADFAKITRWVYFRDFPKISQEVEVR